MARKAHHVRSHSSQCDYLQVPIVRRRSPNLQASPTMGKEEDLLLQEQSQPLTQYADGQDGGDIGCVALNGREVAGNGLRGAHGGQCRSSGLASIRSCSRHHRRVVGARVLSKKVVSWCGRRCVVRSHLCVYYTRSRSICILVR